MNILEQIIIQKRIEVARCQLENRTNELENMPVFSREVYSISDYLINKNKTGIIAEFKRRSPSKGIINDSASVEEVTGKYEQFGASAISVLTDSSFFGGSMRDLQKARKCNIPILRKDFIIHEYQIIESKAYGADVILLIAACLTINEVKKFSAFAKSLGLEVLLEIHDQSELNHIGENIDVVGINTRDLRTFQVNKDQSTELVKLIPGDLLKIAESGIKSAKDVLEFKNGGFNGFLIGETFMKEENPGEAFYNFVKQL